MLMTCTDCNRLLGRLCAHSGYDQESKHQHSAHQPSFLPNATSELADRLLDTRREVGICGYAVWIFGHAALLLRSCEFPFGACSGCIELTLL